MLKTVSSITNAIGALNYKGTWNASTNSPTLASGVGTKGDYYVVSVAGNTTIDGTSAWGVGDWIAFNGSVWQKVEGGSAELTVNAQTGTTYTLDLTDAGKLVTLTNASPITLTVPTNAVSAFAIGTQIDIAQLGAGQVTVSSAATIRATPGAKLRAQYSAGSLIKIATDEWLLVGDLTS
jgi:hypothetical protein